MVTKNFVIGSCTETLEMDGKGRFILNHSNIEAAPSFLTEEQAWAWFTKHYPNGSLGDVISQAQEWFASRRGNLSVTNGKAETEKAKEVETRAVFFSLLAPHAQHVSLAGDFNGWNTASHPMEKHWDGVWKLSIELARGDYEYRFFVDGAWLNDPQNVESVPNEFGSFNNVVRVK
jgi:hypothetical protein